MRNVITIALVGYCMIGEAAGSKRGGGGNGRGRPGGKTTMTLFERQSDDGPRHSPLFNLPVSGSATDTFPMKMVLFNNDLYDAEENLIAEDSNGLIGYNQGHCVETEASDGFTAECFFTYVLDEGTLTANGPFLFDATEGVLPSMLAVTGGTGDYKGASGEVMISAGPAETFPSLQFDFDFSTN